MKFVVVKLVKILINFEAEFLENSPHETDESCKIL